MRKLKLTLPLLALIFGAVFFLTLKKESSARNVIYIMVDTLRADHLGFNGYERDTSPVIDAFSKESLNFTYAFSTAPWTPPSVASQLSGLYSASHNMLPPRSRGKAKTRSLHFNSNIVTLPEALKNHGYHTAAVSPNPWISAEFGFDKEFDEFTFINRARAEEVNKTAYGLIDKLSESGKPFFLYLHYLDPHDPYKPPKQYVKLFSKELTSGNYSKEDQKRIMRYDGEIKYLDDQMAELFKYLKNKGIYENSIIVFTADHGEQFNEHGDLGHGYQLYNEEVHVPLIIKSPRGDIKRAVDTKVSLIDIYPTVLDMLGIKAIEGLQGISLLDSAKLEARSGVMSEIGRVYLQKAFIGTDNKKLIVGVPTEDEALTLNDVTVFDKVVGVFRKSVQQKEEMLEPTKGELDAMIKALKEIYEKTKNVKITPGNEHGGVSDETLDQLQSLGYF